MGRRSLAGGAKKRPTRYGAGATSETLARALRAHRKGALGEAIEGYRAELARDARSLDASVNLGTALAHVGLAREAEAALHEAAALGAGDARVQRDVGIGLSAIGRHEASSYALREAIRLDPTLHGARLFAVRVALDAGDREAALALAREAVRASPEDPSAHLELHRVVFDDRALGPAIDAAARAARLRPDDGLARHLLAAALTIAGDGEGARAALAGPGVAPHAADAIAFLAGVRTSATRFFSHRRDTLRFAVASAPLVGATVELGVRHGVSLRWIAETTPTSVHGFDSFEGLPAAWLGRPRGAFSTAGEVPDVPGHVALHVGLFEDTLPPFAAASTEPLRLLHVDSDLYESARTGLALLEGRIAAGTILAFDEYLGNAGWRDDEHRALTEAVARFGWRVEYLALSWITGQAVVRVG